MILTVSWLPSASDTHGNHRPNLTVPVVSIAPRSPSGNRSVICVPARYAVFATNRVHATRMSYSSGEEPFSASTQLKLFPNNEGASRSPDVKGQRNPGQRQLCHLSRQLRISQTVSCQNEVTCRISRTATPLSPTQRHEATSS